MNPLPFQPPFPEASAEGLVDAEVAGIGSTLRGLDPWPLDSNCPRRGDFCGIGIAVVRSAAVAWVAGVGLRLAAALALGVGVPGGIRVWPRPCDAEADETGGGVPIARGVMAGLEAGAATDAAVCAGVMMTDGAEADVPGVVAPRSTGVIAGPPPLTNFFEGALGGGVASDFIFCRVLFASS